MTRPTRPSRDDAGQVPTGLVVVVLLGVLLVGVVGVVGLGRATSEVGQTRTAADAAALAGAQEEERRLLAVLLSPPPDLAGLEAALVPEGCGRGRAAAQEYAARNGADVLGYCYDADVDRIEVLVRQRVGDPVSDEGPVESRAVAELGAALGPCEVDDPRADEPDPAPVPPPAPPAPGEPPTPTPPPPPPDRDVTVSCGDLELEARVDGVTDALGGLPDVAEELRDLLRPRLVG